MNCVISGGLHSGIGFKHHGALQEASKNNVPDFPWLGNFTRRKRFCKQIDKRRDLNRVFSQKVYALHQIPPAGPLFLRIRRTCEHEQFKMCFPVSLNRFHFASRKCCGLCHYPVLIDFSGIRNSRPRRYLWHCVSSQATNAKRSWHNSRTLLHKAAAAVAIVVFLMLAILYGRSRVRAYIQDEVLPPIAALLGVYCQREVKLGNVQNVSLFGIKLTSCSVGTHSEEFSCGELPDVEFRLRPVQSLLRGKFVLDAMVLQPIVLVSQKQDWTWLGIPAPSVKQPTRQSSEPGLDSRRNIRRAAREETSVTWAKSRDAAAKNSAQLGYSLIEVVTDSTSSKTAVEMDSSTLSNLKSSDTTSSQENCEVGMVNASNGMIIEKDRNTVFDADQSDEDSFSSNQKINTDVKEDRTQTWLRRLMKLKPTMGEKVPTGLRLRRSGSDLKNWLQSKLKWPRKPSFLRARNHSVTSPVAKVELQKRILHGSAAAAQAWFSKHDEQKPRESEAEDHVLVHRFMAKPESVIGSFEHGKAVMDGQDVGAKTSADTTPKRDILSKFSTRIQAVVGKGSTAKPKKSIRAENKGNSWPVVVDSVYFVDGTIMLLAYGDRGPRLIEEVKGHVCFSSNYEQLTVHLTGSPREWRTVNFTGDGGTIMVDVNIDVRQQKWCVRITGHNLFAPLGERLLEIPLDLSDGRVDGEVNFWMEKGDTFPSFSGKIDMKELELHIWEAPSRFKGLRGTLFFQGQRVFFHNAVGYYGAIPLNVSGDIDLNPENGEYRLSCQAYGVEVNALMETLNVRPPPFSLAGVVRAIVYCRGPLDAPIFDGSAEAIRHSIDTTYMIPSSVASTSIQQNHVKGAVAAYDRVAFSSVSTNFTFNSDNCVADIFGIKATPIAGGEIRGAGDMWICPEGESDLTATNIDLSGQFPVDETLQDYIPNLVDLPSANLGPVKGEAKIRGPLLMPVFDIKWVTLEAKGPFNGAHGSINISHDAVVINSSAFTFDLYLKARIAEPMLYKGNAKQLDQAHAELPRVEGLDADLRLRGFDVIKLTTASSLISLPSSDDPHVKISGRLKLQGRVIDGISSQSNSSKAASSQGHAWPSTFKLNENFGMIGDVWLSGIKLNQLLIAPQLSGSLEFSSTSFKLHTSGRPDEQFCIQFYRGRQQDISIVSSADLSLNQVMMNGLSISLQRGKLRVNLIYQPQYFAKLEVRNLLLDDLEVSSLRGAVQKVEVRLNLKKRRGHGKLSLQRPRFSGVQGEALDISARWSGDVVTLEKAVLEQAISRYELQGEYVLPGSRDRSVSGTEKKDSGMWENVMAGQLKNIITSLGRWRLRFEVPRAEISEMLPLARLLLQSTDPAVVWRSKELFVQGVENLEFGLENLMQQLEYFKRIKPTETLEEGTSQPMPLPKLEELKGRWYGAIDASGGGNGDTTADFDLNGEEWEWETHKTQRVTIVGGYCNTVGLRLEKIFIQKDAATLHADGTLLGPKSNLHFAVLNFPIGLVPPLLHAYRYSTLKSSPLLTFPHSLANGILHMEGDLRGHLERPQCDVQVRLLDGVLGGVNLGRAEVSASRTSANRLFFSAVFEPAAQGGHVHVKGSFPMGSDDQIAVEMDNDVEKKNTSNGWMNQQSWGQERVEPSQANNENKMGQENFGSQLGESVKAFKNEMITTGALHVDAAVKDGGMKLITAVSPYVNWLQGNADIKMQVRGTVEKPEASGNAIFHKATISSPFLPKPIFGLGGNIALELDELHVAGLEGRVGKRGHLEVRGKLPVHFQESASNKSIEVKAEFLEIRARNLYSGQVDGKVQVTGSLLEPEVTGAIKLSHGEAYLSQEKSLNAMSSAIPGTSSGGYSWMTSKERIARNISSEVIHFPKEFKERSVDESKTQGNVSEMPVAVRLKAFKLHLGPELRMVYPLILNFAVSGELELSGFADPLQLKPKGTLTFENGDVNLVATQVRLNRDYPNRAKFEPEQGLDPSLDLALVGADWQLKVQGRAQNWQDNLVLTSTRSGEQDALTKFEAAKVFENQLAESLLEGDGQIALKKLAAATVETLMPKIETKGEFGQARWRLVYAPQIPNLLSLDPTTDPFKSLANLSFGTEVEVQLGAHLQASVVRQLKESEMTTQWTLIYQLNNKLRILFSSIPSVDNRLLLEYSATSQN